MQNISDESLIDIQTKINNIDPNNTTELNSIDTITNDLSNIFITSANKTFDSQNKKFISNHKKHKPWFGIQCKIARKVYNKARKKYLKYPSQENKIHYKSSCKNYKATMNKHINKYNKENEYKLRKMQSKRPKDYWKYLNKANQTIKTNNTPTVEALFEHFKKVSNNTDHDVDDNDILHQIQISNSNNCLNSPITATEIEKCISKLKNSKSPGIDNIINEYIKYTKSKMLNIYVSLFNLVFDTGYIPSAWSEGIIVPIYKNKGDSLEPVNYRPITLLSCISKLFTAVLNQRINNYLETEEILQENQAGFRANYSTTDHIFTLNSIIEILRHSKKKVYCAFVDFSKAFDSVWHIGLYQKLLAYNINGKFFRIIQNIYSNIKNCITINNEKSNFFQSNCGIRQGENLSPILFSLFLNDLETELRDKGFQGINFLDPNDNLTTILQILVLLYADDTILMSDNPEQLQHCLNIFQNYCKQWKLNVNTDKTKIVIFGSKAKPKLKFTLDGRELEIVNIYKYLGTYFNRSGSFLTTRKHLAQQARKALFLIYKRVNNLNLPIDLIFKLFDHTIMPIMTYSAEVWGYEDNLILEKIHCEYIRKVLHLRKSTPKYMLFAETGRYPLEINIKTRMIAYWAKLITGKSSKLSYQIYKYMLQLNNFESKWITQIKNILNQCGMQEYWLNQTDFVDKTTHLKIKQILLDQNLQNWNSTLQNSHKGRYYSNIKENISLEQYLLKLDKSNYLQLLKYRTGNHFLPVETGRWSDVDYSDRKCYLCNSTDVGDEMHYLLICPKFENERKAYLKKYFYNRPSTLKFKQILSITNIIELQRLCKFIKIILERVVRQN